MNWETALITIFGSSSIVALVGEIILYKIKRKDAKEDKTLDEIKDLKIALMTMMRSQIIGRCKEALLQGEITFADREEIIESFRVYEKNLHGNNGVGEYVTLMKSLPIKDNI